jgi:hypothetical protein
MADGSLNSCAFIEHRQRFPALPQDRRLPMKFRTKAILGALAAVTLTGAVAVAQTGWRREPPSPETMQRMQEGRLAMAVTALKMNEAQLKLWAPVEANIKTSQAARMKEMVARFEQRKAGAAAQPRPELPDQLEKMSANMLERAERTKAFVAVFKPFYATLTDEQKKVVGPVLAELQGGRRGHGNRWAMHHRGGRGEAPQPQ